MYYTTSMAIEQAEAKKKMEKTAVAKKEKIAVAKTSSDNNVRQQEQAPVTKVGENASTKTRQELARAAAVAKEEEAVKAGFAAVEAAKVAPSLITTSASTKAKARAAGNDIDADEPPQTEQTKDRKIKRERWWKVWRWFGKGD
jgi:hypothetical protein